MKNLKQNRPRYIFKTIVMPGMLFAILLGIMFFGIWRFNNVSIDQDRSLTEVAITKGAVQCYADEGRFPATLEYLEENYDVHIRHDRFNIVYSCPASNVFPNIKVFRKR